MSLAKYVRLICSEAKSGVLRALFHPEIEIITHIDNHNQLDVTASLTWCSTRNSSPEKQQWIISSVESS